MIYQIKSLKISYELDGSQTKKIGENNVKKSK